MREKLTKKAAFTTYLIIIKVGSQKDDEFASQNGIWLRAGSNVVKRFVADRTQWRSRFDTSFVIRSWSSAVALILKEN